MVTFPFYGELVDLLGSQVYIRTKDREGFHEYQGKAYSVSRVAVTVNIGTEKDPNNVSVFLDDILDVRLA
jgi:hypothetical protein